MIATASSLPTRLTGTGYGDSRRGGGDRKEDVMENFIGKVVENAVGFFIAGLVLHFLFG